MLNARPLPGSTTKILALLIALAAMLLVAGPITADAGASSGGVSAQESSPTKASGKNGKYSRIWERTSKRNKRWAHRVADCESGHNPRAIGGGGRYRGAFQFMRSTWRNSPKSPGGDPIRYPFKTQAVVAVALKRQQGSSPWPSCG